jgi:hypothetical protein
MGRKLLATAFFLTVKVANFVQKAALLAKALPRAVDP